MAKKKEADISTQNNENSQTYKTETIGDEEPDFSDPEDYIDNIKDEGKFLVLYAL